MNLLTILAFAILFLQGEQPGSWLLVGEQDIVWTLAVVVLQPPLLGVTASLAARRAQRLLVEQPGAPEVAQRFHYRATLVLRTAAFGGFAAMVFLTRWPQWFAFTTITPALQIVGDLLVLSPFLAGVVVLWLAAYPLEQTMQARSVRIRPPSASLRSYLGFNLRHHVLIVAVPMTLILFAANMTRGYEQTLQDLSGWAATPDVLFGVVALGVFVVAPLMLRRIWHTVPLEAGPVRERLETVCSRIGMHCRDILVWHSGGVMVNAAVIGVFAPVRFVLLSDALLATMDVEQIEAVFGHEAGHVRLRHMQHFLVFAFVGWLLVVGLMELLARSATEPGSTAALSAMTVEGIGLAATVCFWGVGFGWLSRRFEREADLFGARCATPGESQCALPCSIHSDFAGRACRADQEQVVRTTDPTELGGCGCVCATGAATFTSALDRVALLNGIPLEERSWRHSSIGSRIRFLVSLSGDPHRTAQFERLVRRVRIAMLIAAIIGSALCVYYWIVVGQPAILQWQVGGH